MGKPVNDSKTLELINLLKEYSEENSSNEVESIIEFLEDFEDKQSMDNIERYKKVYNAGRLDKCVEILIDIGMLDSNNFKKRFLLSNALISPFSNKFNEVEYEKAMQIFFNIISKAKGFHFDKEYMHTLEEMYFYTKLFYENNKTNTARLQNSQFFEYSLSEQLCMICIFLQDQSRIMQDKINETIKSKSVVTGMEADITFFEDAYVPNKQSSASDGYEAKVEIYNVLIQYLYYLKKEELDKRDIDNDIDVHPYELPCFEELTIIAYQRMMYLKLEEKFRYSNWKITSGINEYEKDTYLFEPADVESCVAHQVAIHRRQILYTKSLMVSSVISEDDFDYMYSLSKKIDIDLLNFHCIEKNEYDIVKKYFESTRSAVKRECKPYYLKCKIRDLSVEDLLDGHEFLNTISKVYMTACLEKFNEDDYSSYKYLAPRIELEHLVSSFAKLYDLHIEKAKKIIFEFVYDKNTSKDGGDIFMYPLIKVDNDRVILCQTLIEQMNLNRNIEKAFQRKKVNLSQAGKEYEKYVVDQLKGNRYIRVNTNTIEFLAYDGKNVEFDFLGVMNDFLILIECKSVLTPYDDKELHDRRRTIREGVDQVLRRAKIIQNDWIKIREMANIDLPLDPYPNDKIIKVVCTDIYDFTTLNMDGVRITDDSTLLKYLTNPIISKVQINYEETIIIPEKMLWKNGCPTPQGLLDYLDNPDTVSHFSNSIHEKQIPILYFKDDNCILFKDMYLDEDPFIKENLFKDSKSTLKRDRKVYPNEKCPCGSGIKYKKCCGKSK